MNTTASLREAIAQLDSLPAMPRIAQEIMALQLDTDEGERELLKLIGKDPQISAKIIGLANAPLFGASKRVTAVSDAAMLLGINRVKVLAMGIAVMSAMTRKPSGIFNAQDLWQHSLTSALAMRTMARAMPSRTRPLDDEIFLAGLLHDIGYMVLDHIDVKLSDAFHTRIAAEPQRPVPEIEAEMLELDHTELGAALARHWDLPEHIIAVLRYHHQPDDENAAVGQPLAAMSNLAERLLPAFGITGEVKPEIAAEEWESLGIDPAKGEEIIAAAQEHAKEVAATFN